VTIRSWGFDSPLSHQSPPHRGIALAVALTQAAVVAVAVLFATLLPRGLESLSYDSFRYLAGAESILAHGTYRDIDGVPQQVWPPGTSLLYAAASRATGLPPLGLVVPLNLLAMLVALIAFAALLRAAGVRWWIAMTAFVALAWNGEFLSETDKLWSDPLTVPALVTMLWCLVEACFADERRARRLLLLANAALAAGILFRFAMLAGIALVMAVTWWVARRHPRLLRLLIVPLLTPIPMVIAFVALHAVEGNRSWTLSLSTIAEQMGPNLVSFAELATQVLPGAGLVTCLIVMLACIAMPLFAATSPAAPARPRAAIVIAIGWFFAYLVFLVLAQAVTVPSFDTVTRILFLLYPAMLLAAACAVEIFPRRALGLVVTLVLGIAAARAVHFVAGGLRAHRHGVVVDPPGVPRREVIEQIVRVTPPVPAPLLTNSQGLAWFALRRPTILLTRETLAVAPAGSLILWVKPEAACIYATEQTDTTREEALAGANALRDAGVVALGRKAR
jgi:hypothetical protein